jgi:ribonuclease Z
VISFTGDTQPCSSLKELGRDADIFIHEATFLQRNLEKARPPKHSTPKQAASAASLAQSKKLVLTHVNDDSEKPEEMLAEAGEVFSNVVVAYDGLKLDL